MRINLTSVLVDDQGKALRFYTEILGFESDCATSASPSRRSRPTSAR